MSSNYCDSERLQKELYGLLPSPLSNGIRVIPPPYGTDTAWFGARLISNVSMLNLLFLLQGSFWVVYVQNFFFLCFSNLNNIVHFKSCYSLIYKKKFNHYSSRIFIKPQDKKKSGENNL